MKAKTLKPILHNGEPVKVGDVIDLDPQPFANLKRKGWVIGYDENEQLAPRKRVVKEAEPV